MSGTVSTRTCNKELTGVHMIGFPTGMTTLHRGRKGVSDEERALRGNRFKALRKEFFATQQAFADAGEAEGLERTYASKWENGISLVTTSEMAERLGRVFQIKGSTLIEYLEGRRLIGDVLAERASARITLPENDRLPEAFVLAMAKHPQKDHPRFKAACASASVLRNEQGFDALTADVWADTITQQIRTIELAAFQASKASQDDLDVKPKGLRTR